MNSPTVMSTIDTTATLSQPWVLDRPHPRASDFWPELSGDALLHSEEADRGPLALALAKLLLAAWRRDEHGESL